MKLFVCFDTGCSFKVYSIKAVVMCVCICVCMCVIFLMSDLLRSEVSGQQFQNRAYNVFSCCPVLPNGGVFVFVLMVLGVELRALPLKPHPSPSPQVF
jgi:hypothetical protein